MEVVLSSISISLPVYLTVAPTWRTEGAGSLGAVRLDQSLRIAPLCILRGWRNLDWKFSGTFVVRLLLLSLRERQNFSFSFEATFCGKGWQIIKPANTQWAIIFSCINLTYFIGLRNGEAVCSSPGIHNQGEMILFFKYQGSTLFSGGVESQPINPLSSQCRPIILLKLYPFSHVG